MKYINQPRICAACTAGASFQFCALQALGLFLCVSSWREKKSFCKSPLSLSVAPRLNRVVCVFWEHSGCLWLCRILIMLSCMLRWLGDPFLLLQSASWERFLCMEKQFWNRHACMHVVYLRTFHRSVLVNGVRPHVVFFCASVWI
jgi:hypothetical protein